MATYYDARLIIELSRWAQDWGFHEANAWLEQHADELRDYADFKRRFPAGTSEFKHIFTVLGFFENVGLFRKHGVIDEELLFDWLDFTRPWSELAAVALGHRKDRENPTLWQNFEALAQGQRHWKARFADSVPSIAGDLG